MRIRGSPRSMPLWMIFAARSGVVRAMAAKRSMARPWSLEPVSSTCQRALRTMLVLTPP